MSWIEDPGVEIFGSLNMSQLNVDEAWLNVSSEASVPLWLYEVSGNCHKCPFQRKFVNPIAPGRSNTFKIQTRFPSTYRLRTEGSLRYISETDDTDVFCEVNNSPGEFGVYNVYADSKKDNFTQNCSIITELEPVNIYLPLLLVVIFYLSLASIIFLGKKYQTKIKHIFDFVVSRFQDANDYSNIPIDAGDGQSVTSQSVPSTSSQDSVSSASSGRKRNKRQQRNSTVENRPEASPSSSMQETSGSQNPVCQQSQKERLKSLDAFRGLYIVIMIFADNGGGMYYFFQHCTWDGLYVADVAFPCFLWIMGTCIPISIQGQLRRNTKTTILKKVILRSIKLVCLGLIINTSSSSKPTPLTMIRIPGVLQRFGICYFIASVLFLYLSSDSGHIAEAQEQASDTSLWRKFRPFLPWVIVIMGVIIHSLVIFLLPVPGCPTGYLGPGGLHFNKKYPSHCIGGATGYIDRFLFSTNHIYQWSPARKVYHSGPFDPEGTLGLLTSLFQVWLGVQTGIILLTSQFQQASKLWRILLLGIATGICGLILCGGFGGGNSGWIPVNKNLWSLSYVFVTTSLALLLLCCMYYLIDVKGYWSGSPLIEPGMNSILLYVGHDIAHSLVPWNFEFGRMNTHFNFLVENLWGTSLWIVVSVYLCNKKVFWVV